MSARSKVQLYGQNRFVYIDTDATNGAVIGDNVFNADGSLFDPDSIATPAAGSDVPVTLWSLIQNIPVNVTAIAALAGDGYVVKTGSSFAVVDSPDSAVPFFIPDGDIYTVAANKQALFALPIELEGSATLVIDGALVEVG